MLQLCAESVDDTHAVAAAVAGLARPGDIIVLAGELGTGKTAFAQGFGRSLGVTEPITSPTFTLVHSYPIGKLTLHHADLYRLERTTELADLALAELADDHGIVLVEWGDVADESLGDHLVVHLAFDADADADADDAGGVEGDLVPAGRRLIEIHGVGGSWAGRWARLVEDCGAYAC
jgi:tRNA threonylcarbamoyladenosine biosynthesis protein TsaE